VNSGRTTRGSYFATNAYQQFYEKINRQASPPKATSPPVERDEPPGLRKSVNGFLSFAQQQCRARLLELLGQHREKSATAGAGPGRPASPSQGASAAGGGAENTRNGGARPSYFGSEAYKNLYNEMNGQTSSGPRRFVPPPKPAAGGGAKPNGIPPQPANSPPPGPANPSSSRPSAAASKPVRAAVLPPSFATRHYEGGWAEIGESVTADLRVAKELDAKGRAIVGSWGKLFGIDTAGLYEVSKQDLETPQFFQEKNADIDAVRSHINKECRRLNLITHPDRNGGSSDANELSKGINGTRDNAFRELDRFSDDLLEEVARSQASQSTGRRAV